MRDRQDKNSRGMAQTPRARPWTSTSKALNPFSSSIASGPLNPSGQSNLTVMPSVAGRSRRRVAGRRSPVKICPALSSRKAGERRMLKTRSTPIATRTTRSGMTASLPTGSMNPHTTSASTASRRRRGAGRISAAPQCGQSPPSGHHRACALRFLRLDQA